MVQTIIDLDENEDRILNIVKAQYNFKNKSQAAQLILKLYGENFLEPELRPEFLAELKEIKKGKHGPTFNSIDELRKHIESM
ncbi:MAG: DUF2683 family protein [Nanoarchaeota archaeon]|nr:DUF2683 family protein [Nanoarchaeota archaeon]